MQPDREFQLWYRCGKGSDLGLDLLVALGVIEAWF